MASPLRRRGIHDAFADVTGAAKQGEAFPGVVGRRFEIRAARAASGTRAGAMGNASPLRVSRRALFGVIDHSAAEKGEAFPRVFTAGA